MSKLLDCCCRYRLPNTIVDWSVWVDISVSGNYLKQFLFKSTRNINNNLLLPQLCVRTYCKEQNIVQSLKRKSYGTQDYRSKYDMENSKCVFQGKIDRFNGVIVDSETEYEENMDFATKLENSLQFWSETNTRAVWFRVKTEHSDWLKDLLKNGFDYHHANKGIVVLNRWLSKEETANIPIYAHTMVGVGGLVINDNNEVLVVSDRFALVPDSWKLPGGYVEPRENLVDGVIREVKEETGIDTEFKTLVSVRHSHGGNFGCSDIYVIFALKPKNLELQRCEREISKLKWMPVSEFLVHPQVQETNRMFVRTLKEMDDKGVTFTAEQQIHPYLKKEYSIYYLTTNNEKNSKSS